MAGAGVMGRGWRAGEWMEGWTPCFAVVLVVVVVVVAAVAV